MSDWPDIAHYSLDRRYRYLYQRRWAESASPKLDTVVWLLLNPATGDTDGKPRRTLNRCINWSQSWGFASLTIINLFAYRATKPAALRTAGDPVGPENDETIRRVTQSAPLVVTAWGAKGRLFGRSKQVTLMLTNPMCLGVTKKGEPRHPLYVRRDAELRSFRSE